MQIKKAKGEPSSHVLQFASSFCEEITKLTINIFFERIFFLHEVCYIFRQHMTWKECYQKTSRATYSCSKRFNTGQLHGFKAVFNAYKARSQEDHKPENDVSGSFHEW